MDIKILVATNVDYRFPKDSMYLPIQAGSAIWDKCREDIQTDDTGDNISAKNASFCELTALYWGWKNLDCEYLGLCHYRRYFGNKKPVEKWHKVMTEREAEDLMFQKYPVVVTRKREYMIETLYSHYGHTHHSVDLKTTRKILAEKWPEYLKDYDEVMDRSSAHMFNMFVMRKDLADEYCEWLFAVLFELEKRLDVSGYSDFDKRVFGRVSELLLDVWLQHRGIVYAEVPLVFMENPHWFKKGTKFLQAKFWSGKEL